MHNTPGATSNIGAASAPTPSNAPLRAGLWMMGAVFGFSSMAVSGRMLAAQLDTFEIMFYRSIISLGIMIAIFAVMRDFDPMRPRAQRLHLLRNLCHFAGQNLWLYALTLIPLAQLFALEFSYPLIVTLLAAVFLGERLNQRRILTGLVGFIGVIIVARPFDQAGLSVGLIAALLCAFGFAGSALVTKRLTREPGVTIGSILFWLAAWQLLFGAICAGYDGDIARPDAFTALFLVFISIGGLGAHFCLTKALSLAPASIVTPIDFLRLPLISVIGMMFYNEQVQWTLFAGAIIIFSANYVNILAESRGRRRG